jgi:alpha-mannosidase
LVQIPLAHARGGFRDLNGQPVLAQRMESGWAVWCRDVPALGWTTLTFDPTASTADAAPVFEVGDRYLVTPYYRCEWNAQGQWTRLYDREQDREILAPGELGNCLEVYEDKPLAFDAWDIDWFYQEKRRVVDQLEGFFVRSVGPVLAQLEFVWRYGRSRIRQFVTFYRHSRRIDCQTEVDWHEHQQLLKVAFGVQVRATEATYAIQFGHLKRATHRNTLWDFAKFEVIGHQWADLSEYGYGVSLANDSKYGYAISGNTLRLTLIKSAIHPDPDADQGAHRFAYALFPHPHDPVTARTAAWAWDLNRPLQAVPAESGPERFRLLEPDAPAVMVDAVKMAEDGNGVIVRVHDDAGGHQRVRLLSDWPIDQWQLCNILEEPEAPASTGPIQLELAPFEIKTLRIHFRA